MGVSLILSAGGEVRKASVLCYEVLLYPKEKPWLHSSRVFKIASMLNFNSGMSFSITDQTASSSMPK